MDNLDPGAVRSSMSGDSTIKLTIELDGSRKRVLEFISHKKPCIMSLIFSEADIF